MTEVREITFANKSKLYCVVESGYDEFRLVAFITSLNIGHKIVDIKTVGKVLAAVGDKSLQPQRDFSKLIDECRNKKPEEEKPVLNFAPEIASIFIS